MSHTYCPPPYSAPDLCFFDDALIVLNKPTGLLSVPGRGPEKADCLESRLRERFSDARIVHRLDMETSGLMVLARDNHTHRALSAQFEHRKVEKQYIARVAGKMKQRKGEIDLPLIVDWPNRPLQKVDLVNGKPSLTQWQTLETFPHTSRLRLSPLTGRSHQLRVHLNAIGHPILGDSLYGTTQSKGAAQRLQLHASLLAFRHPGTGERLEHQSPAPF